MKTHRVQSSTIFCNCLVAVFLPLTWSAAQQPPSAPPSFAEMRSFMTEARSLNSLKEDSIPPFHLKAAYTLYGMDGKAADQGTMTIDQVSSTKYVVAFKSPVYSHVAYATGREDKAVFIAGADGSSQAFPLNLLWGIFVKPLPDDSVFMQFAAVSTAQMELPKFGKFTCLRMYANPVKPAPDATTYKMPPPDVAYCFENGTKKFTALFGKSGIVISRFPVVAFEGHVVPKEVSVVSNGKQMLTAQIEEIRKIEKVDDALFVPPSDAKLYPTQPYVGPPLPKLDGLGGGPNSSVRIVNSGDTKRVMISAGVAQGMLLSKTTPAYPPIAKAAGVQGTVVLQCRISKTGDMEDLQVVEGPPLLRQSAIEAVKTWKYRPYLLGGEPVEVETTINVIYELSERPAANSNQPATGTAPPQPQ